MGSRLTFNIQSPVDVAEIERRQTAIIAENGSGPSRIATRSVAGAARTEPAQP